MGAACTVRAGMEGKVMRGDGGRVVRAGMEGEGARAG